jgi:hypothetical protein
MNSRSILQFLPPFSSQMFKDDWIKKKSLTDLLEFTKNNSRIGRLQKKLQEKPAFKLHPFEWQLRSHINFTKWENTSFYKVSSWSKDIPSRLKHATLRAEKEQGKPKCLWRFTVVPEKEIPAQSQSPKKACLCSTREGGGGGRNKRESRSPPSRQVRTSSQWRMGFEVPGSAGVLLPARE